VNKKKTGVTIGFDIGLNILLALDNGETYGMHFMRYLKRVDKQIINLQNSLKKEYGKHVKLKEFKEYNNLIRRRKARIKNEINRLLNKIVNKHDIDTITLESLDFRGSKLARKVNRLLTNFGMSQLKNKLQSLKEDKGIKISYTDAAYTSQTCSNINCGYIDKKNRKSQKEFKCKFCGKKLNADVNGSRIVKKFNERFGEKRFYTHVDRSNKRTLIVNDFIDSEVWVNSSRRAIQELSDNDYFSNYNPILREKLEHLS
jgi:putative transposase